MFEFQFDKKTISLILASIVLVWILTAGTAKILELLLVIPAVLIALTFHEFAHAFVAVKLGDDTPKYQNRVTLNPLKHIDPMGFVCLIVAGFGWGKPVQIDPRNFNGKLSVSKAEAVVAIAGPITNFILAFIFMIIYYAIYKTTNIMMATSIWQIALYYVVMINIGLGIFNLIPIPPLDGSKVLISCLSYKARNWFFENEKYFYIIFLILLVTRISNFVLNPIFNGVYSGMASLVKAIFRVF